MPFHTHQVGNKINKYEALVTTHTSKKTWVTHWERGVAQLCPTLCNPTDCSPPGSSVHGIFQAWILEWVAISFSRGSSQPRDWTEVSHIAGRCFNLCTTREALKYKNPSTNSKDFKGGKEARREEEGGGGGKGGRKRWPYRCLLPPTDTQALWDFSLGLQRREDWNSALPEIRQDQNQNLSSLPRGGDQFPILSSGWGPFDQIPASRTRGLEKQGRIGRVK